MMSVKSVFLVVFSHLLISTSISAQKSIKLLSWNVYMLPSKTLSMHSNMKRAKRMVEQFLLSDYDVICVQELFDSRVRKYFCSQLKEKYPYQVGYDDQSGWIRTNSGLYTFSKYPALKVNEIKYSQCDISDCFADKGAIAVRVSVGEKQVHIVNTHLQAGRDSTQENIRISQLKELSKISDSISNFSELIYTGDFNICKSKSVANMIDILEVYPVIWKLSTHSHPSSDYGNRDSEKVYLDYILKGMESSLQISTQVIDVESPWKRRGKKRLSLSDHRALSCEIRFPN